MRCMALSAGVKDSGEVVNFSVIGGRGYFWEDRWLACDSRCPFVSSDTCSFNCMKV